MGLKAMREIERRASEAKCPLPAEEGWVMEKERKKGLGWCGYVKKPMVGEPWVLGMRSSLVLLDSFFEGFECISANSFGGWLRGEHHLFAGEGVSTFASFGSWLIANFQFKKAWQGEDAWAFFAKLFNDDGVEGIENSNDLLFGKLGVFSDGAKYLAFGHGFFLIGHSKKLP
jgi:hypothetical protein